ncbi:MAG: hypothetical protein EU533_00290 [Promethearchaeota archaeon]|nr:MAG: hypothetical protein EU533_00290 [Candidatus Lokiarchaeota archaeon]
MSKIDTFNVLLYGDQEAVSKFRKYLALYRDDKAPSQNALVYFEFPNEKFTHRKYPQHFNYKLRLFLLQPLLLKTIITPKKEFREADAIIMLVNNSQFSLSDDCIEYFSKISQIRKSYIPLLIIGMNCNGATPRRDLNKFFYNLQLKKTFSKVFGVNSFYFDINEDKNEATLFRRLPELLESTKTWVSKEYTPLTIDRMITKLLTKLHEITDYKFDIEHGIHLLTEFEHLNKITITRHSLELIWGLNNTESKSIMEFWENRINLDDLPKEELDILTQESNTQIDNCFRYNFEPNLVNLLALGNSIVDSKKILAILKKNHQIESISYHNPTLEYQTYDNLQDLIILHNGRHLYTRTKSETNEIAIFSGLMQTMEIVRDKYMKSGINGTQFLQFNDVDYLDFGNLHAVLGTGVSGVKVILRFKKHPEKIYIQKTQKFIQIIEDQFKNILEQRVIDLDRIKPSMDKLFYRYFNPFPEDIPYDRIFTLSEENYSDKKKSLTKLEDQIVALIRKKSQMTINQIITHISDKNDGYISESDVLSRVLDLIEENILL